MDTIQDNPLVYYISVVVIILMAIGTVFVFSASANVSFDIELHRFYDLPSLRQIIFFPLAIIIMFAVSRIDFHKLQLSNDLKKSPAAWLLAASVILLMLVLIPKFGTEINQARRWFHLNLGFMMLSFQPSELAKWATILFMVGFCYKYKDEMHLFKKRFLPACAIMCVPVGLILIEDFGTAALITLLSVMILLIGGARWKHVLAPAPLGIVAFVGAIFMAPHRIQRLAAFWNPEEWADTVAYQANQSLIALGSGGVFGKGVGCGICKYGHLPEDTTDFIFAIVGEEMGFVGTVAVIALFIAFIWLGAKVVKSCTDDYGKFLAATIVMAIGTQAALNIGVVTVVLPTKGLPLPFVSAGGTSMLLTAAAVGVLLNIAKQTTPKSKMVLIRDRKEISDESDIFITDTSRHEPFEQLVIEEKTQPAIAEEPHKIQIIEHEQAQAVLEEQASELIAANEKLQHEFDEYQQVIEQQEHHEPEQQVIEQPKQEPHEIEQKVNRRVFELKAAKKQPKPKTPQPLNTKQLEDLAAMTKRLSQK